MATRKQGRCRISEPGGDPTGDPNVTPTGERLEKDNPNYREGFEDFKAPDHRTAEEKQADPRK
jgi:hypothetical protein